MELEKLRRSQLYRLESIDDESKSTVIEDKVNKLSHQIGCEEGMPMLQYANWKRKE